jgi:hypothetical protein
MRFNTLARIVELNHFKSGGYGSDMDALQY